MPEPGDPTPITPEGELLAKVLDELRAMNRRAEQDHQDRGQGELREPAKPRSARKPAAKKPAAKSRRRGKS